MARVNPRVRVFRVTRKFAHAANTVKYSSTKDTKGSDDKNSELRALRVLRGEKFLSYSAAALPRKPSVVNSRIFLGRLRRARGLDGASSLDLFST